MVTLNNHDALVVRDGLTALAGYASTQSTVGLMRWMDTLGIAPEDLNLRGTLTAARLTSIADGINGELPPELRAGTPAPAPSSDT
jgi:hypothetical protein